MNLKDLLREDDAVSPVIGVILMVAITVILAAVIGTFVLGLGDQVQSSAPNANFQFEYPDSDYADAGDDDVTVTHNGGQDVNSGNLEIQIGSDSFTQTDFDDDWDDSGATTISTGDSETVAATGDSAGEDVRVVWESPNGGSSNTIGSSTVPS